MNQDDLFTQDMTAWLVATMRPVHFAHWFQQKFGASWETRYPGVEVSVVQALYHTAFVTHERFGYLPSKDVAGVTRFVDPKSQQTCGCEVAD